MKIRNTKLSKKEYSIRLKGILSISIASISLLLMLLMPYIIYTDNSIDLSINISGFRYLLSSFSGKYVTNTDYFGELIFGYNTVFSVLTWIMMVSIIAFIGIIIYKYFIKKDESTWVGFIPWGIACFQFIFYIAFIVGNCFKLENLNGEIVPFYKSFEFGVSILIVFVLNLLNGIICKGITAKNADKVKRYLPLYFMLIIPTAFILIFSIYPIFLQTILSFKNYKIDTMIWKSDWVGLDNFKVMFTDFTMLHMLKNTVIISLCRMVLGIIPPLILAILLFDIGSAKYRKILQTIIYIPHFFSWVIIFAITYAFVNQEGIINNIIVSLGGERITFFNNDSIFYPLILITDVWKELGWGTILFLAALSGVDPNLYEAASMDGAGAMDKLFKITIPSIAPTIIFVSIMAIGNILKGSGGEQLLLFGTDAMESAQTIDTWVIWKGLQGLQYGLSAAVSFFQSAIGLILVLTCNHYSKKWANMGIW